MASIGTYEAEGSLSHLLERIERGEKITITRGGKAVAMLVPAPVEGDETSDGRTTVHETLAWHDPERPTPRADPPRGDRSAKDLRHTSADDVAEVPQETLTRPRPSEVSQKPSIVDAAGRLLPISDSELRRRNEAAIRSLRALKEMGDEEEQRETLEDLMKALDEDRLSDRKLFS